MISRSLSRFVVDSQWRDMPAALRHEAKRSVVNVIGTALGGSSDAATRRTALTLAPFSAPAEATIIGRREQMSCLDAAFVNALAGNVFDFDDTHPGTIIHPSAPVAPPLFAFAQRRPMSGADLLHAFILGVEIECRLGNAVSPFHYKRGWHITATCGVFGAAAAIGKVLGLDETHMLWALGNASAQSSGLVETLGTMAKSIGVGQSARGGLLAALLAQNGVEGPELPLEGPRGFLQVMGSDPDLAGLTAGLGERWELLRNTYKPYPCGVVLNPVVDAVLALREQGYVPPERISGIRVLGHPLLGERADRPAVTTGREAQVSAQHAVAVAWIEGRAGVTEFSDERVRAPDVLALRDRVTVGQEVGHTVDGARVEITLVDGAVLDRVVKAARGSTDNPLSDAEISEKFRTLAAHGCPGLDPEPLLAALWNLDEAPDAGRVIALSAFG
ncbi:MmgE/PrpD family protein [Bosea sp. 124]|uniref:MmgE/PrpD family protein n=1 Tax=Bosea sp. 124 TaxID=2135642 RepID=UPI000D3CF544|nr:MmgE/PrpD family protein [Bosea sp. 124]PTM39774.1 2-methylcitrate dehydratase PrpD [Bosea sp. 124]